MEVREHPSLWRGHISLFVAAMLTKILFYVLSEFGSFALKNWRVHGDVYLTALRNRFEKYKQDPVRLTQELRNFERYIDESIESPHALAIMELCDKYRPLSLASFPREVETHLRQLSSEGNLVGSYEGVTLALPGAAVMKALSFKDRFELFKKQIIETEDGVMFREDYAEFCKSFLHTSFRKIRSKPLMEMVDCVLGYLQLASVRTLWHVLSGRVAFYTPQASAFVALRDFVKLDNCKIIRIAKKCVDTWEALMERAIPSEKVQTWYPDLSLDQLWSLWTNGYVNYFLPHMLTMAARVPNKMKGCSLKSRRTAITGYVGYLNILVRSLQKGLFHPDQQASLLTTLSHLNKFTSALNCIYAAVNQSYICGAGPWHGVASVESLKSLAEVGLLHALDALASTVEFDPAQMETYMNSTRLTLLQTYIPTLFSSQQLQLLPGVREPVLKFLLQFTKRSALTEENKKLGYVEVALPSGKKVFTPFNTVIHIQCDQFGLQQLKQFMSALSGQSADDAVVKDMVLRAWAMYRARTHTPQLEDPKCPRSVKEKFIAEVRVLPVVVQRAEEQYIRGLAQCFLLENNFGPIAPALADMQFLDEAMFQGVDTEVRDNWLLRYGRIDVPLVRQLLEASTSDREASIRLQNHKRILERSMVIGLHEMAVSVSYVQKRIKNEAGLYRPEVYNYLAANAGAIVLLSLTGGAQDVEADVETITKAYEKMLRDDTTKRDSVAKNTFKGIGRTLINTAITFQEGLDKNLKVRSIWVRCGVQLDWIVLKTIQGDSGWKSYSWPLNCAPAEKTNLLRNVIAEEELAQLKPLAEKYFKGGLDQFVRLRRAVFSSGMHVHVPDREAVFGPAEAVDILVDALYSVQKVQLDVSDPEQGAWLQQDFNQLDKGLISISPVSSTSLSRMEALLMLVGWRWQEVPAITAFVDAITEPLYGEPERTNLYDHATRTNTFFTRLCQASGELWFEIPRLARLSEGLMHYSLACRVTRGIVKSVLPQWQTLRKLKGKADLSSLPTLQLAFLSSQTSGLTSLFLEKESNTLRQCSMIAHLLAVDRSAIHVFFEEVSSLRDDILLPYLTAPAKELVGRFQTAAPAPAAALEPVAFPIPLTLLSTFNSACMQSVTQTYINKALDMKNSAVVRSGFVTKFVESYASSHMDVITLIKRLSECIGKEGEQGDDAAELLLESVILGVFKTDAAWFVLAHLLNPDVIASSNQRTTASILTNLKQWVPVHKAVSVLQILLSKQRRWAIKFFLHKSILRMLFECKTEESLELFYQEWVHRKVHQLHKDLQFEIVLLCVHAVNDTDPAVVKVVWSILDSVAADTELDPSLTILLFAPTWYPQQR